MTEEHPEEPRPPSDYRLLVPDGWFRILLEPEHRKAAVGALVEQQYRGIDNAPHLKEQTRRELLDRAAEAHRGGGIELYISLQTAGPVGIPASLVVTLAPPPHEGQVPLEALAKAIADDGPVDQDVTIEELPAGRAVRVRTRTVPPADDPSGNPLPVTSVDYHLPVPGTNAFLLLAFSSPLDPIADDMAALFDAVAASLTWTE
ncbi:hypothetical protein O7599_23715 [Streptomyces sp. WMMC500]|uniref:hypothetical protein n=1 Tax=Streptomyces sp. WMMC500 TaxID=3015154 RepID=UPI00248BBAEC|nr:hypothetical protein [Streptomyces sp. WMMC500]WBB58621.1 hypothetical protein O7599_23715 [Streptomyces sp. WMMC500]